MLDQSTPLGSDEDLPQGNPGGQQFRSLFCYALLLLSAASLIATCPAGGADEVNREWLMYQDPVLAKPQVATRFPEGLPELWLQALERPERDLKRRAAGAVALARRKGLTGLETTIPALIRILEDPQQDRSVILAAARALSELDASQAAPLLYGLIDSSDLELAEIVEPTLAAWKHPPMLELFRERLRGPIVPRSHVLAIRGLLALEASEAIGELMELAETASVPAAVRLEAAKAIGQLQSQDLLEPVRRLMARDTPTAMVDHLVAVHLLKSHRGEETEEVLVELALNPEPAVRSIALELLFEIDPALILPTVETNIASEDATVRRWVAKTLTTLPSVDRIRPLTTLLDDPHPQIREFACDSLFDLAKQDEFRDTVFEEGRRMLRNGEWRGLEQSIVLLVSMEDRSIVDRLLELLEAQRAEVHATAAWGLARLAVESTAPAVLEVFSRRTDFALAGDYRGDRIYLQTCHLAQALGQMQYEPADEYLRKYVAKGQSLMTQARAAAIWSLGKLHAGTPDDDLVKRLRDRLVDINSMNPERAEVRTMAAIALGRMKATGSVDAIRDMQGIERQRNAVGFACTWAIHELTGEPIPPPRDNVFWEEDWFLVPIKEDVDSEEPGE